MASSGDEASMILAAILVIAVALVLTVLAYLAYLASPRGRMDQALEDRLVSRSAGSRWSVRIGVVVLIAVALLGTDHLISRPARCARCHQGSGHISSLEVSEHADTSCMSCHRAVGPLSPARQAVTYTRWMVVYGVTKEPPRPSAGSVDSAACLRCHSDVTRGTTQRDGVRVRHSDFLEAGWQCRECHNGIAHPGVVIEPTEPSMDKCLYCHDGETASTACEGCHPDEAGRYTVAAHELPKIESIDEARCYECHDEREECLWCHGVTMPHPTGWSPSEGGPGNSGSHARPGFVDKDVCWRCHYSEGIFEPSWGTEQGCTCHPQDMTLMHGGRPWVDEHWRQATGSKPGQFADCYLCHSSQKFCANCHPASYASRYDPRVGEDRYTREVPLPPEYLDF